MKSDQDYARDLYEIRSMMERSSKFLSLSGWAGIMAGIYALAGAYLAVWVLDFHPDAIMYPGAGAAESASPMPYVVLLAFVILALATGTAAFFSYRNAQSKGERAWNPTSRRLLANMAIPLVAGGVLLLALLSSGLWGLLAPLSLLFYGLALVSAAQFTFNEVRLLGIAQIVLGLAGVWFVEYGMLLWAVGFGLVHIAYGVYMKVRYGL